MTDLDDALATFTSVRPRLFGIAYRMLGSASEAQDIVQEAWLRWQACDRAAVLQPAAFLATTTTRLAINYAQSARARRETYIGPWLPEPVDTSSDPLLGAERGEALGFAVEAARAGEKEGHWVPGGTVAARIEWALDLVEGCTVEQGIARVFDCVGTGVISQESVPAAFAVLKLAEGDAWKAAVIAANLGGDTDTIGAIAGSMAGACAGYESLPTDRIADLVGIDLDAVKLLARALVQARLAGAEGRHG